MPGHTGSPTSLSSASLACHRSCAALSLLFYFANFCLFVTCWTCLAGRDRDRDSTLILAALPEIYDPHTHTNSEFLLVFLRARTTIEIGNKMCTRMKNVQIMCAICVESGLWHLWLAFAFLWPFKKLLIFRCEIHLILWLPTIHKHTHTCLWKTVMSALGSSAKKPEGEGEWEREQGRRAQIASGAHKLL